MYRDNKFIHELEPDRASEVLVLDSCTFIREIGLMSQKGSALKHYLYCRGTQLVVPQAAAEEYERHLISLAQDKVEKIQKELRWLAQFLGKVEGWLAPSDEAIKDRAQVLVIGNDLNAMLLTESKGILTRAQARAKAKKPPCHRKPASKTGDCRIWEQCLELLSSHDVIFVTENKKDFCNENKPEELHPYLRAEALKVGNDRNLTFHPSMESLLSELESEVPTLPNQQIFEFIYEESNDTIQELELNSGCRPTASGSIEQAWLTTEAPDVIEVRLKVKDTWESDDGATSLLFELTGTCRHHLGRQNFFDLRIDVVHLLTEDPDGSIRAVKGSYVNLRPEPMYIGGMPPIRAQTGTLK